MITPIKTSHGIAIIVTSFLISLFFVNWASKQIDFTALSILPSSQIAAVADFDSNLVAHYTFDDTANDSVGSNHGTISGGAMYTTGKIGQGLSFDGIDDKVTSTSDFIGTGADTIAMWIYPRSYGETGLGALVTNGVLRYFMNGGDNSYRFRGDGATTSQIPVDSLNQWVHLVVTRDASGVTNFYKNGVQTGIADQGSGTPVAGSVVVVGNNVATGNTFDGLIDDVRFYNRTLFANEIRQLYALGSGKTESDLNLTPTNGQCDITENICIQGILNNTSDSSTQYLWQCVGSNGGITDSCSLAKLTDPDPTRNSNVRYVSTTGMDSNPGTQTQPWRTIQHAANTVRAGDTVYIGSGMYNENVTVGVSGTLESPVLFKGIGNPKIGAIHVISPASYLIFEDFTVSSNSSIFYGGGLPHLIVIDELGPHHVTVNNIILNPQNAGLLGGVFLGGHHNIVTNCVVENFGLGTNSGSVGVHVSGYNNTLTKTIFRNADNPDAAIFIHGHDNVVSYNEASNITNSRYDLAHVDFIQTHGTGCPSCTAYNIIIDGNYVHDGQFQGIMASKGAGHDFRNWTIRNNIFANIEYFSAIITYLPNFHIYNNVFYNVGLPNNATINLRSSTQPDYNSTATGARIYNNVFLNVSNQSIVNEVGGSEAPLFDKNYAGNVTGSIFSPICCGYLKNTSGLINGIDPKFVDLVRADFRFQSTSPLINAGVDLSSTGFSQDILGTPRPQGSAWDIGAYEYTGTVVNPSPTVYTPGDFNRDGIVNAQDFSLLKLVWNQSNTTYDLNTDGIVNSLDYVIMVRNWTG